MGIGWGGMGEGLGGGVLGVTLIGNGQNRPEADAFCEETDWPLYIGCSLIEPHSHQHWRLLADEPVGLSCTSAPHITDTKRHEITQPFIHHSPANTRLNSNNAEAQLRR